MHIRTISAFLSLANMACSTLARQLEAVINEVSMAQVLRLRTNPWRVHKAKHLPPTKVTYSRTKFHSDQASYLYLYLLNLQFFKPLLTWWATQNQSSLTITGLVSQHQEMSSNKVIPQVYWVGIQHYSTCNGYAFWLDCAPRSDSLFLSVVTATHTDTSWFDSLFHNCPIVAI